MNATALIGLWLRNTKEYEAICEENRAVVSRDQFKEIYHAATSEPYSFKSADEMFYLRF